MWCCNWGRLTWDWTAVCVHPPHIAYIPYFRVSTGFSKWQGKNFLGRTCPFSHPTPPLPAQSGCQEYVALLWSLDMICLLGSLGWFIKPQQSAVGESFSCPLPARLHTPVNWCLVTSLLEHAEKLWWLMESGDMRNRGCVKPSKWSLGYVVVSDYRVSTHRWCFRFCGPVNTLALQCCSCAGSSSDLLCWTFLQNFHINNMQLLWTDSEQLQ